jgi:release factor glutamine methyltransferase
VNIAQAITSAAAELQGAEIPESLKEAGSLLQFAIARDRAFVVAHPEYELTEQERASFADAISRRVTRQPFQQITGKQEFYGLDFIVTPDVLIPRPETEILVERAIEILGESEARFLDIGVGSGCISIAILKNCPKVSGTAVDVSEAAIEVAGRNAEMHGVKVRLIIKLSDVYNDIVRERFGLIVSNPPYVPAADIETLQPEVRDHEPHIALTDGSTGLSIIERIVVGAPEHLKPGGYLLMEIGFGQHEMVDRLFDRTVWNSVEFLPDLQGIPRMVAARINGT